MADAPTTQPSLLVRIRDAHDAEAWRQFAELYGPLVYRFARKRGLQDADAADLTQEVLQAVNGAAGRLDYDPRRGTFRAWLYTVARNKLLNFLAGRKRPGQGTGDTAAQDLLEKQPAPEGKDSDLWDQEYDRRLFAWAAEQVRGQVQEATWQAFWQTTVEGKSAAEVAKGLGMTVGSVYVAKSRVQARLKEQIQQLQCE